MSGDDHDTGDLDLDALERLYADRRYSDEFLGSLARNGTVPALVAEVRRLRAERQALYSSIEEYALNQDNQRAEDGT